jgi:hypothetical protein
MIPMNSSAKLTDTQLVILSAASQREDRCLTAPKNLKGGAAQKVAVKLLEAGLVREIKARAGMAIWRRDEEAGQAYSLKLTAAGLKTIAVDESESQPDASMGASPNANEESSKAKKVADITAKRARRQRQHRRRPAGARRSHASSSCSNAIRARGWTN